MTSQASYPNHDSKAVLDAFDPNQDLVLQDLNGHVEKGVQGGAQGTGEQSTSMASANDSEHHGWRKEAILF